MKDTVRMRLCLGICLRQFFNLVDKLQHQTQPLNIILCTVQERGICCLWSIMRHLWLLVCDSKIRLISAQQSHRNSISWIKSDSIAKISAKTYVYKFDFGPKQRITRMKDEKSSFSSLSLAKLTLPSTKCSIKFSKFSKLKNTSKEMSRLPWDKQDSDIWYWSLICTSVHKDAYA